jgi:FecR protein
MQAFKKLFLGLFFGGAFLVSAVAAEVGSVVRSSGTVSIISIDGKTRTLSQGDPVSIGDTISTQQSSQAMIRLLDKSTLLVRESSKVVLKDFKFAKATDDRVQTNIVTGAVRAVSGAIAKANPSSVNYAVGTATVGIRGTDIELAILPEGRPDRAGIYNYVYSGETQMTLASGESVNVEKDSSGFSPSTPKEGEPRLMILRDRPAFIQSTGFDALIQQLSTPRIPAIR